VTEWFEHWFGEEYLSLYPHRDEQDAERLVGMLERRGTVRAGLVVLDLACGAGRHATALARRGATVVGLDLSWPLLLAARRQAPSPLVRADMRILPFGEGAFDTVLNLFTSFGYFEDDAEHRRVLAEVARVLRPRGRFVLDYLNAPRVRSDLVPRDEHAVGGRVIVQERSLSPDGRFVIKDIHLVGDGRSFRERVRLFERAELEAMLTESGLAPLETLGDYDGVPHGPGSERLLLVAVRA
jgi:SAM-dependent methyltransferase